MCRNDKTRKLIDELHIKLVVKMKEALLTAKKGNRFEVFKQNWPRGSYNPAEVKMGRGICNESKDKEDFHDGGGSSGVRLLRRYV